MISRRTALLLGQLYEARYHRYRDYYVRGNKQQDYVIESTQFYDFLYERNYAAGFCNIVKGLKSYHRQIQETIMKLHTGESIANATPTWSWEQRQKKGQEYLFNLAEDILIYYSENPPSAKYYKNQVELLAKLTSSLELDGYIFRDKKLLIPEKDVLEIQEEIGIIETLYSSLNLKNKEITFHHLTLSEEHYFEEKWDDSISNSRKFLESVLREIANQHFEMENKTDFPKNIYESPVKIRDYLETAGLLENKEKEAIAKLYGLLSNTGGHPYIAEKDQARLLRQLSLTLTQFVLLRYQGYKTR